DAARPSGTARWPRRGTAAAPRCAGRATGSAAARGACPRATGSPPASRARWSGRVLSAARVLRSLQGLHLEIGLAEQDVRGLLRRHDGAVLAAGVVIGEDDDFLRPGAVLDGPRRHRLARHPLARLHQQLLGVVGEEALFLAK